MSRDRRRVLLQLKHVSQTGVIVTSHLAPDHKVATKTKEDPIKDSSKEHRLLATDFRDYLPWCDVLPSVNDSKDNDGAIMMLSGPAFM